VSAKDKATGKEQSIVIKASSGLSDDEIDRMVKDAEAHAEDDKKFEKLVTVRNTADGLIHATRKTLADAADKVDPAEKEKIESAIAALEDAMKAGEVEQIEARTNELTEASSGLAQKMYAEQQAASGQADGSNGSAGGAQASDAADDAVDAEFEEVKDDK
jgi:molecular chaperone DnaK